MPKATRSRHVVRLLGVVALLAATVVAVDSAPLAEATSGGGGSPYDVPLAVDTNASATVFETNIASDETPGVDIGNGELANVQTFNGHIPGPEIRVNVGDTVIVHYENHLATASGIHWHGIELDNTSDGTPLVQNMVPPAGKFLYKFIVPRPGVYWYHPHHHSSTNQVFKGLYGSLIVHDPGDATLQGNGVLPSAANTHTMVLSDITVCHPGSNPTASYPAGSPHVSGALPVQGGPTPAVLCDTPIDEEGKAIETDGNGIDGDAPAVPLLEDDVPNIQRKDTLTVPSNEGNIVLTNGKNVGPRAGDQNAPGALGGTALTLPVAPGSGHRFQVVNTAQVRFFRLRLTDSLGAQIKLIRVGGEGGLLNNAVTDGTQPSGYDFKYDDGEIVLGPGDRADVVAAFPAASTGVATLWTLDFQRIGTGSSSQPWAGLPTVPVAHFDLSLPPVAQYSLAVGASLRTNPAVNLPVSILGASTSSFITPTGGFVAPKLGMASTDIVLNAGGGTFINGVKGLHEAPGDYTTFPTIGSTRYAASVGDTLELTVSNDTAAQHPFHPHGFSMQPKTLEHPLGTVLYTFPTEFADTVNVPAHTSLRYRVKLDDRPLIDGVTPGGAMGRWVFHCHIFFHAVFGMISEIIVTDANGNEKPYVNANDVSTPTLNQGDPATMSGTFSDPENDPVTLTSSDGPVIDNGGGTWTWNGTATGNKYVYVTATDSNGHKDQAAFKVDMVQVPQTITFTSSPPNPALVGGTYTPTATGGGSGNPVVFSIDASSAAGACTFGGGVVSLTGPGQCVLDANQAGNDDYLAAAQQQQSFSVGFSTTVTGKHKGSLTVNAGESVFLAPGAVIGGSVTVKPGGTLWSDGAKISGSLKSTSASLIHICGSTITGPSTMTKTAGGVVLGDVNGPTPCAGNVITGNVAITGNFASVDFDSNKVSGSLTITGNTGPIEAINNNVSGKVKIQP